MNIDMRLIFLAIIMIVINLYFWIFKREAIRKWPDGFRYLLYISWIAIILAIIDSFIPLNM
jgi:hypothetical protein